MALSTGNIILWSDISAVLNNVNRARRNCGFGDTSIPGAVGTYTSTSNVSALYDALRTCHGKVFPADGGTVSVKTISMPSIWSLITPDALNEINEEANRIAAMNSSNFGFGFNSGFNSSNFGFGFNASFNTNFSCSCQTFTFSCGSGCTFSSGGGNGSFSFRFSFLNTKDDNYIRRAHERKNTSKWNFTPTR